MLGGLIFKGEIDKLKHEIEKAIKRGVNVKILTNPQCNIDGDIIHLAEQLKDLQCELKIAQAPIPLTKGIIRDNVEMITTFCKISDGRAISNTAIGIWNHYIEFTKIVSSIYSQILASNFFEKTNNNT